MKTQTMDLLIDGRSVHAREGETVLQAARGASIDIPTLCFLDGMEGFGACRLCVVEVGPFVEGRGRMVASCAHPAAAGMEVKTRTRRVDLVRRTVLDLLLARCPSSEEVRRLAASYGVGDTRYAPDVDRDKCILCAICVRVCMEVGPRAISASGRGPDREITTPFREPSADCIGCLSCAKACPTGNIPFEEDGARRSVWGREFQRVACPRCGRPGATREQIGWYVSKHGWSEAALALCDACKRADTAKTFFGLMRL